MGGVPYIWKIHRICIMEFCKISTPARTADDIASI